jgi:predicted ATPase
VGHCQERARQGRDRKDARRPGCVSGDRGTIVAAIFPSLLTAACIEAGDHDGALSALNEALQAADEHEIRHYEAEMHRLKGELLLKRSESNIMEAQHCFERAVQIARKQSAKSLELRATMSLARLLSDTGRRDDAHTMLSEIYNWFTEGFDTADLKEAKVLLDELTA